MKAAAAAVRLLQSFSAEGLRGMMTARFLNGVLRLIKPRAGRIDSNLKLVFPDSSEEWRREFRGKVYENISWTLAELLALQRDHSQALRWVTDVEGRDIIDRLSEQGHGALFLTAHFGNWELLGSWYSQYIMQRGGKLSVIYQEIHDRDIAKIVRDMRINSGIEPLPKGVSTTELVRKLKGGAHIAVLADVSWLGGIKLPFMGHDCTNSAGPAILSMLSGAPIVPAAIYREAPFRHRARFFEPLTLPQTGDRRERAEAMTLAVNQAVERIISIRPELWFWLHNRWK